jgi:hypothetical protein
VDAVPAIEITAPARETRVIARGDLLLALLLSR